MRLGGARIADRQTKLSSSALGDRVKRLRRRVVDKHDLELVGRLCHRVTVINQGHHIFTGTPAAAQREPEVVRAYLGMNQLISGGGDDACG